MNSSENKAQVARFFAAMSARDFDAMAAFMAPDHRFYFPLSPEPLDAEAHVGMNRQFGKAVEQLQWTIEEQLVDGDKVATRGYITGVHNGEFNGLPPTGNPVRVNYINIIQLREGLSVNEWDSMDTFALMQQLGAVPAPE